MLDQYFGTKDLTEVVLRAKVPMMFGDRRLEAGEAVLYFEKISMSVLSERNKVVMARGGWANMPRVIWEDRSEVTFNFTEGVMSSIGMSILLNANVLSNSNLEKPLLMSKREGPFNLLYDEDDDTWSLIELTYTPNLKDKKGFIYEYDRDVTQKKVYGKLKKDGKTIKVYQDEECTIIGDASKQYLVDYYFNYNKPALVYLIQKERFNGLFSLEGKFYSKDENDGLNYTNLIYMPKVRVVSDINLRLGERADPTTSVFTIIGMPEKTEESNNLILNITRLGEDLDADV